jgi:predicted nucleic acid-binding protein
VSAKKEIVIQDTCTLFDLVDLNLLAVFFQLDLVVFTTPQVISEVTDEKQWKEVSVFIESTRLEIDGQGRYESILEIAGTNPGLSFADSTVVELALRKQATVLSSDGSLRKVSAAKGLDVHGMLWIIEQLCESNLLSGMDAIAKLNDYVRINQRAPKNEVESLSIKIKERHTQ